MQNFGAVTVSLGTQSIVVQGIGESRYGADAGASASLSLSNTARLYINYDGKYPRRDAVAPGHARPRVQMVAAARFPRSRGVRA